MNKRIERFEQLRNQLLTRPKRHATLLIGIDAPSGSGKSVFTRALCNALPPATIVQMDDFFLPTAQRPEGDPTTKPIGADFDWQRVFAQVVTIRVPRARRSPSRWQPASQSRQR